jgi:site-specific DNA-methyltransferase (adenine-specific)
VRVHSDPGDLVLDFFAGSGTAGEAAAKHGRSFLLVDESAEAIRVMEKRLAKHSPQMESAGNGSSVEGDGSVTDSA